MPRQRPAASGYARLAQADEDDGHPFLESDDETFNATNTLSTRYESIVPSGPRDAMRSGSHTPSRRRLRDRRRLRSNSSGVDIKAINARLERWAEEIASKFKIHSVKGKSHEEEKLEIHHSVFQAPEGVRPLTAEQLAEYQAPEGEDRINKAQFEAVVESVRIAIEQGVHPKMISQGSSGSYFARNSEGKVVGVFKPKDEEPYASRNPKWTKWIHRNLFPCFFGRACLIPNLSYVSEAAAYVLDERLRTNLVPYTDIVRLSSKSFFYDFWQRTSFRRGKKSLPAKAGSFQVFLKGYKDANIFLREHPWPDQNGNDIKAGLEQGRKRKPYRVCVPGQAVSDDEDEESRVMSPPPQAEVPRFKWTSSLKQALREELEKLVILDYIMRNTDRGLDNWMIKIDWKSEEVSIVAEPPKVNGTGPELAAPAPRPVSISPRPESNTSRPYKRYEAMDSRSSTPLNNKDERGPTIKIGAIDNSLSWPWKHPDAWRSFPFGWLFLPVSLIGQPFSKKTRDHFLPLLTSTAWWSETQTALRRIFSQDDDFQESMFARQIAVMKGQAWNVVETLKQPDHGPLELTRRTRVCVWDDLVDVPVAIPMRVPSAEMTRKNIRLDDYDEEEIDIGISTHASAPSKGVTSDLLGSPTTELPNPNRFDLTRDDNTTDLTSGPTSPATIGHSEWMSSSQIMDQAKEASTNLSNSLTLPSRPSVRKHTRFSFEFPRTNKNSHAIASTSGSGKRRHRSASMRSKDGSGMKGGPAMVYEGDDLEGDLGYAAASDMEGNRRKVIVERLEAVKSKNPVFTWC